MPRVHRPAGAGDDRCRERPDWLLVILVVGATALTLAAAQAPARRATTVSLVLALAVD